MITKQLGLGHYDWWRNFEPEWDNTTHVSDLLNAEAIKVVKEHHASQKKADGKAYLPFFMHLSHLAPHDPLVPVSPDHMDKCAHVKNYRRKVYCSLVSHMDEGNVVCT